MEDRVCPGFKFSGIASGLKKNGGKDLGLIYSEVPANVAGLFTRNRVQAAPVLFDRQRITSGVCQAVIVNSGNANCCTGDQGIRDAIAMANAAATGLGISENSVLVASTGVIGEQLPVAKIEVAVPDLVASASSKGVTDFAEAIMTTDTKPKVVCRQGHSHGKIFTIIGAAKGAGMIRPDMATLLCFLVSDVQAPSAVMKEMLVAATDKSLNRITVDGDTSTNDTVLLLANGKSDIKIESRDQKATFQRVLDDVMVKLAKLLVKDGEGATKLVEIIVKGAVTDKEARQIADTVAHSNLLKTALFGEDANWGRILAAAGRAGVPIEPDRIDVFFDDVQMVSQGIGCGKSIEIQATAVLKKPEFAITIDLHMGNGRSFVYTCDFSVDYVKINADYRS
ncbi:MAG: bifunctional glutamate N-acetyltransferase/amino-acid acetyltransferase ArgJ [Deltaproteobacteria bacterium]|nr:MAG: bifunctional glutamate N-acetyltransferase/amino-acid acetyltransferase ArgJ [Deltaproteobacteria bacterium]